MSVGRIPFLDLRLAEDAADVEAAIRRVLERGWFVLGPEVEAFEREFAAASGAAYAVGTGTGTDAIALLLRAAGVRPGDEVITTPLSAAYTALAVMMIGARPVFADLDPDRMTLDPRAAESAITPRTAAILPVHLYGQPADMDALSRLAGRRGLALVEDCCQAHLATSGGRPVGTFGVGGAFSFYPTKNLGALGDAGMVITNDAALADHVRRLRNGGQIDRYRHEEAGVNSRLDELQAAILRARLPRLNNYTRIRRSLASSYRAGLTGAPVAVPPELDPGHVYHLFPVRTTMRSALQAHLSDAGIETLVHYPIPMPRQQAFAGANPAQCPIADRICHEVLSLPLHVGLRPSDLIRVAEAVQSFRAGISNAPRERLS